MKVYRDESGQVMVLTVLCMTCFIGFLALAIDVGLVFRAKRNMQIAADAAATAAALDYLYNSSSGTAIAAAKTVGTTAASINGYSTSTGATITINSGDKGEITTPWHNSHGYFEAIISQPNPTAFMGFFGTSSMTVKARAVAGSPGIVNQACLYILNPQNVCPAASFQGSFTVTATKCGVMVNGTCGDALDFTGGGGTLTAASISVQGGAGGKTGDATPAPVTGVAPVTNPLQSIVPPDPTTLSCTPVGGGKKGGTLTGTIGTAGTTTCYSGDVTLSNATLSGLIVFTGNVTLDGTIASGGGGATIDLNSGGLLENTGTSINLSPPGSGTYEGVSLLAPASNTSTIEFDKGSSWGTFSGIIDAPGAYLYLHDSGGDKNGGLVLNADVIIGTVFDQTATWTINSWSESNPTSSPLLHVALVE